MNNKVEMATRLRFRDWLRAQLRELDFYQRRGDHYLIREFAKYCVEHGAPIDEASLGRYLRDDEPVLPTPERCRSLARVFECAPVLVLIEAGYLEGDDFFAAPPKGTSGAKANKIAASRRDIVAQAAKQAGNVEPLKVVIDLMGQSVSQVQTPAEKPAEAAADVRAAVKNR